MTWSSYSRRQFSGSAPDTTLSADLSSSGLSVAVTDGTGWPDGSTGPFVVIFEPADTSAGASNEERGLATSRVGNTITMDSTYGRGWDGTTAVPHSASTAVRHGGSKTDFDEANYGVSQTVGLIQAKGDLLQGTSANAFERIIIGSTGQALVVNSSGKWVAGTPAMGITDVSGLSTQLGSKVATPTGVAAGVILVGQDDGTFVVLTPATDGEVLTLSGGTPTWAVSPSNTPLGYTDDSTATSTISGTTSLTALDSTNATLTFTAPTSGSVLLRISGQASVANNPTQLGWVTHGTTTRVGRLHVNTPVASIRGTWEQVVTGLTAGTSYHLDLACQNTSLATQTSFSEVLLSAWAAS